MNKELKQLIDLDTMILNTSTDELYKNSDVNFLIGWQSGALGSFDDYLINDLYINCELLEKYNLFLNVTNIFNEKYEFTPCLLICILIMTRADAQ